MKNEDIRTIVGKVQDRDTYLVNWNVTRLCNYACDFCIQGNHEKHLLEAREESRGTRAAVCRGLCRLIEEEIAGRYRKVLILLIGGEVTILKELPELVGRLIHCNFDGEIRINITTNLSFSLKYADRIFEKFRQYQGSGQRVLYLSGSFYKAYTSVGAFAEKLHALQKMAEENVMAGERKSFLKLGMGIPILCDEDYEVYLWFREKAQEWKMSCRPILIRKYSVPVSEEIEQKLIESGERFIVTEKNGTESRYRHLQDVAHAIEDSPSFNPYGYFCDAGWNSIHIDRKGDVYRCPMPRSGNCFGSVKDGKIMRSVGMTVCGADRCNCSVFRLITKDPELTGIRSLKELAD